MIKPPSSIQTERLLLRKPCMEDATIIYQTYASDPKVTRYLTWKPHQSIQETYRFLMACDELWQTGKDYAYAVTLRTDNSLAGMFAIHPMNSKIEVGYVLARPYWGEGYMTEALRGVVDWAFSRPDIYRVQAFCDVENIGSARVMEKVGMVREGLMRKYVVHPNISSEPRDSFMYAIVK